MRGACKNYRKPIWQYGWVKVKVFVKIWTPIDIESTTGASASSEDNEHQYGSPSWSQGWSSCRGPARSKTFAGTSVLSPSWIQRMLCMSYLSMWHASPYCIEYETSILQAAHQQQLQVHFLSGILRHWQIKSVVDLRCWCKRDISYPSYPLNFWQVKQSQACCYSQTSPPPQTDSWAFWHTNTSDIKWCVQNQQI